LAGAARFSHRLPGGATWSHILRRGEVLELVDVDGGANAALLLIAARDPSERLNLPDTLKAQHVARITAGVALYSDMGRVMASVIEDSCGWHDPLAGHARNAELEALYGPSSFETDGNGRRTGAREELILELAKHGLGEGTRVEALVAIGHVEREHAVDVGAVDGDPRRLPQDADPKLARLPVADGVDEGQRRGLAVLAQEVNLVAQARQSADQAGVVDVAAGAPQEVAVEDENAHGR